MNRNDIQKFSGNTVQNWPDWVAPLFYKARFVGACRILNAAYTPCSFLASGIVTITASASYKAGWPTYGACAKFCALDDFKRRIFVIIIKQDSKPPQYFVGFCFVKKPCELPVNILKQTVHDVPEEKKWATWGKSSFMWQQLTIWSGIYS